MFPLDYVEREITAEMKASAKPEDIQALPPRGRAAQTATKTPTSASNCNPWGRSAASSATKTAGSPALWGGNCSNRRPPGTALNIPAKRPAAPAPTAAPTPERKSMSILATTAAMSPCACMEDPRYPLQQIPDAEQRSPYNNFGKLKRAEKRVMVFLRRDMPKQKLRQRTSEHPFGTIKHYDGAGHFLCKGKGEGHSGVRPVRAVLQSPQGDQPVRRRTKSHRALPQHRYAQNAENRRTLRGKPLFFC